MEVKILWTEFAIRQLEQIFEYYKFTASIKVAKKISTQIVEHTMMLEKNPFIGAKEPLLENRANEYRYLVEGNYKIIYCVNDNFVKISSIFDCRLNPGKIIENT